MIFDIEKSPANPRLKADLAKRGSFVIDTQVAMLAGRIRDGVCLNGRFLAKVQLSQPPMKQDGKTVLAPETKLSFLTLTTKQGERYYPVFTDEDELARWRDSAVENVHKVVVGFNDFLPLMKAAPDLDGIVINPMTDNFVMPKALINDWNEQLKKLSELIQKQMELQKKAAEEKKKEAADA
ncbi:MAG: SseB family protein [Lachnospiraceae bacterium]|nr:SseB family protein [Lachnospiraceae bacterium]